MKRKKYFHKNEISELLKGHIGNENVPIYEKTGLPYGMDKNTNETNFIILRGGHNCGHQIFPIMDSVVPDSVKREVELRVGLV